MIYSAKSKKGAELGENALRTVKVVALYMKHKCQVEVASTRQIQAIAVYSRFRGNQSQPEIHERCLEIDSIQVAGNALRGRRQH